MHHTPALDRGRSDNIFVKPRPFLKWAGGKSRLLDSLRHFIPGKYERYIEPFVGGGAMFFDLCPSQAILSDANTDLIVCYQVVKNHPIELFERLMTFEINEPEFYRIRALDPEALSKLERAARFIYLNKTCFNGLYRVNRDGRFNTPFGHSRFVRLADFENLTAASFALQQTKLRSDDYKSLLIEKATRNDFIYLDPPYHPVSEYSDFKRYTGKQFGHADHVELAKIFRKLDKRGCLLALSNSFHPEMIRLYEGFNIAIVNAPRFINCRGDRRGDVKEIIVTNYDP